MCYCNLHSLITGLTLCVDSKGNPRCITNSKGRKRRPGGRELSSAVKTTDLLFLDFIQQCLQWDPERRITPEEALRHRWITEVYISTYITHECTFLGQTILVFVYAFQGNNYKIMNCLGNCCIIIICTLLAYTGSEQSSSWYSSLRSRFS